MTFNLPIVKDSTQNLTNLILFNGFENKILLRFFQYIQVFVMYCDHALVYGIQWKKTDSLDTMIERQRSLWGWLNLTISCQCQIQSTVIVAHLFELIPKTIQSVVLVVL